MKLANINTIAGILSGIKLNKITDKDVKNNLLKTFIEFRKAIKDAEAERLEIITKLKSYSPTLQIKKSLKNELSFLNVLSNKNLIL